MSRSGTYSLAVTLLAAVLAAAPRLSAQESQAPDLSQYEEGWHIVRPGENLHYITRKYLGEKLLWPENWRLNEQIDNPDKLVPGQRIKVLIQRRQSIPTARLRSVAGRVEGKPAPIDWGLSRELDLMLEEDGLRTGDQSSTEMEFQDGTRVLMTEDSVVYLRRRGRRLVGVPPRAVEIVEGQAEVAAQRPVGSEDGIEILVGGTRAVSRPDEQGVAQTRARKAADDGARVMVYEGGTEVESAGEKVLVPRGMGTAVAVGKPPAPPERLLPSPGELSPEPGARLEHNNLRLAWRAVEGAASYTVEICADADCALLIERRTGLEEAAWVPKPPAPGDYFWRVTAVSPSGLDGYPSPAAVLAVLSGPDRVPPSGGLEVIGRQLRFGDRLVVDESVRIEARLEDGQSGVAGWQPIIDGAEVSMDRWTGPWPDGTYQVAVRAADQAGNEAVIAGGEVVVDALPPVIAVTGAGIRGAERPGRDRSSCGWLLQARSRWPLVTQCRWVGKAQSRWLRRGWNWLEVSVDGRRWNPLIAAGSEPAREVAAARYRLPPTPSSVTFGGDDTQLLLRAADGSPLLPPGGGPAAPALRIAVSDAGSGVERVRLEVTEEAGGLALDAQASDALGHRQSLRWQATGTP